MTRRFLPVLFLCFLFLSYLGCSDDPDAPAIPDDNTAPSDVVDLAATIEADTLIVLTWSAPGGDGATGKAAAYDIRYSTSILNSRAWDNASQVQGEPAPADPGNPERFTVPGLRPDSSYYLRMKTRDQAGNMSGLSNLALADADPPATILDLTVTEKTARSVTLWWTAPWDNGYSARADSYEIRYSGENITELNWESAAPAPGPPVPGDAGSPSTYTLSGLEPDSLVYVAVRSRDQGGNLSQLSNVISERTIATGWASFGPYYPNDAVWTMLPAGGNLYVGGDFTEVGSVLASRIAVWNGSEWAAMGAGFTGGIGTTVVRALAFYGVQLVAGGFFGRSGSNITHNVARWDGFEWQPFGTGTDNGILAVATLSGDLFIGGMFWTVGNQDILACARWDGSRWYPMGFHYPGAFGVAELILYEGDLVAAGHFQYASATPANNIAGWDGSAWYALGDGFTNGDPVTNVTAIGIYDGDLVAAGKFQQSGATAVNNIARWDGSAWHPLGAGLGNNPTEDSIMHMTVYNGDLIVVGRFADAGGVSVSHIARWNGSEWAAMGSGITGPEPWTGVFTAAVWDGGLYVGGSFSTAGEASSPFIARWDD